MVCEGLKGLARRRLVRQLLAFAGLAFVAVACTTPGSCLAPYSIAERVPRAAFRNQSRAREMSSGIVSCSRPPLAAVGFVTLSVVSPRLLLGFVMLPPTTLPWRPVFSASASTVLGVFCPDDQLMGLTRRYTLPCRSLAVVPASTAAPASAGGASPVAATGRWHCGARRTTCLMRA